MTSTDTQDREPELISSAVYRTARKPWACECPGNGQRPCPHPDCAGQVEPGQRYVEYLAEAGPFGSGARYCLTCGVATWRADEWTAREQRPSYRSVTRDVAPFALVGAEPYEEVFPL